MTLQLRYHWYFKSIKSGFARALAPYIQNLDFLAPRTSHQKEILYILYKTKGKKFKVQSQRVSHLFGHQVHLSLTSIPIATSPLLGPLLEGFNSSPWVTKIKRRKKLSPCLSFGARDPRDGKRYDSATYGCVKV